MPADHILTYALAMRGGVEAALGRMLPGWLNRGRRVTLILGDEDGQFQGGVPLGVETVTLGHQRYGGLCRALPSAIERVRPDIVFCPGNHYTAMAAWTRARLTDRAKQTILRRRGQPVHPPPPDARRRRRQYCATAPGDGRGRVWQGVVRQDGIGRRARPRGSGDRSGRKSRPGESSGCGRPCGSRLAQCDRIRVAL